MIEGTPVELPGGPRVLVDLSTPIANRAGRQNPRILSLSHETTALQRAKTHGFSPDDLPMPGTHFASEEITAQVHGSGTHVDAPWHYAPTIDGNRARTIDELPLGWFFGSAVVLDCSHLGVDEPITGRHLVEALDGYDLQAGDIVLVRTDGDDPDPWDVSKRPEMTRSAGEYLVGRGIRVIGVDAPSPDRSHYQEMAEGDRDAYFPVHTLGRSYDLCIVELLTNLHRLPHHGFEVALFPVAVQGGSGGWCRAVAFVPPALLSQ